MNTQKPEPRAKGDGSTLDFHSMFFTIQGEGPFAGHRAIFVRLAGCNLQCPGCDTEYTRGRDTYTIHQLSVDVEILAMKNNAPRCLVVITGGEPFRQRIGPFLDLLTDNGHPVQIESNGVLEPDPLASELIVQGRVTLVVSPKTSRIHPECHAMASAFKYVLDHRFINDDDGLPTKALEHPVNAGGVARPRRGVPVYVNPYDDNDGEIYNPGSKIENHHAVANSCMRFGYIAGLQMHKIFNLE